jgi:vitamin B12 transporter
VAGWVANAPRLEAAGIEAAELLRESPGVQVTQAGGFGAPATASLRGATAAQTPVYLAGIRLNDEVGGAANLADIPLFLLDRVEVYRSHAPLVADRLGVGGAVFFEPQRPGEQMLGLGGMGGSFGTRAGWAYLGAGDEHATALAGVELSAADNDYPFFDDRGTLYLGRDDRVARLRNADVRSQSVWLSGRRQVGRAWLSLVFNHAEREQGAPKLALVPSERARVGFQRDLLGLRAEVPVDAWGGGVELHTAAVQNSTEIDDPLSELSLLTPQTRTPGSRIEQTLGGRQTLGRLALVEQLSASIERLQRFEQMGSGSPELQLSARRSVGRVALGAELGLTERLFVEAAGAFECFVTSTGALGLCEQSAPTGRGGASWRAGRYELYANVGRYHRLPTLSELYGASLLVRGRADLLPETGITAEVGGRWQQLGIRRRRVLWADASAFARSTRDLVTYVRTAQGYLYPVNRDAARTVGAEVVLGAAPLRFVDSELALSWLDPRDTSPGRETVNDLLPYQSRFVTSARLTATHEFAKPWLEQGDVTLHALYQSSRYADPAGLGVIPGQTSLDLELGARWCSGRLRAALRVEDLLDTKRFDIVGFPLPRRSGFFSVEGRI